MFDDFKEPPIEGVPAENVSLQEEREHHAPGGARWGAPRIGFWFRGAPNGSRRKSMKAGFILIYKDAATASGLLPAGTAIRRPADTNGTGLEMRYLVRR